MAVIVRRGGSWLDWPMGYRPLLSVGRTAAYQMRVPEAEIAALEEAHNRYGINPLQGAISTSQRLDIVATSMLAESMEGEGHHAKRDILTVWKAKDRWKREITASNLTEAERHIPKVWQEFFDIIDGVVT